MSHEAYIDYELERARRQAIANARVANTTSEYLNTYKRMLEEFENQGLDSYIPSEIERLRNDISAAEMSLQVNAFQSREISMTIQGYIYNMRSLANAVRIEQEEARREQLRREEEERRAQKTESMNAFYETIKQVKDAAVQNAARSDFAKLREAIMAGKVSSRSAVESEMTRILEVANKKAADIKKKALEDAAREGITAQVTDAKERLEKSNINASEKAKMLKSLDDILGQAQSTTAEESQKSLNAVNDQMLQQKVSEDELMEVAKNVCTTLKSQGFAIPANGVHMDDENGEKRIRIFAVQRTGQKAMCILSDKGVLQHSFNGYEGSSCLKDLKSFKDKLQSAYSIKLSNERTLWENPDKISKGELPTGIQDNQWRNK